MTNPLAQDLGGVVLLPCPFGGGRGEVGGIPWVECQACEASGPQAETEEAAIAAWNTRTHSAEIAGALRDAERYRWLRAAHGSMDFGFWQVRDFAGCIIGQQPEELDTAIDSAMQHGGGGE